MTTDSTPTKPKKSWLKLVLFTFLCLSLAGGVVGWMLFGHYAVLFYWNGELNKALIVAKNNSEVGRTRVEQVFNDAIKAKVAPDILMRMYRVYGMSLYQQEEIARADEQIDKAIALGEKEPPTNYAVADQLTHAWQDRATERHYHWKQDPKKPDGVKDQEMSVKVAEAAFGPDHEQTVFKASGLAMMYADVGRYADADKLIDRCIKSAETKDSAKQTAWFCYAMLAHIRAVEHRYQEAIAAYFKNREVSANDDDRERGWDELLSGLRFRKENDSLNNVFKARKLLNKGNFAELDRLGEEYIAKKSHYWNGYWIIDDHMFGLDNGEKVDDIEFNQLKLDLTTYLKKRPNSVVARSGLANLYLYRYVALDDGDPRQTQMLNESRKIFASTPDLANKIPYGYVTLVRIANMEGNKSKVQEVAKRANLRWPTYFSSDVWAAKFSGAYWLGKPGEQKAYITKRCDTVGGAEGDKLYARFAWHYFYHSSGDQPYHGDGQFKWDRIKRGFKQIFKEYPDDVEARIAFMQLALDRDDEDAARNVW